MTYIEFIGRARKILSDHESYHGTILRPGSAMLAYLNALMEEARKPPVCDKCKRPLEES